MKKLMFAAAAIAAGVAVADVTSANIVGYMNQDTRATGSTMVAPVFLTVSSTDGSYTLADLTVTGYDPYDEELDEGGCNGKFYLQRLDANGKVATADVYRWYDYGKKKGWYNNTGTTKIAKPEEVRFDAGEGVWCRGTGLQLVCAGAVKLDKIQFVTRGTGSTACGNGLPVATTLDKITITGYDPYDEELDEGGCNGKFYLQFLDANGKVANTDVYRWYDYGKKKGWYNNTGTTKVDGSKVDIPAGKGFWCRGTGLTLVIPAVFPQEAAE